MRSTTMRGAQNRGKWNSPATNRFDRGRTEMKTHTRIRGLSRLVALSGGQASRKRNRYSGLTMSRLRRALIYKPLVVLMSVLLLPAIPWVERRRRPFDSRPTRRSPAAPAVRQLCPSFGTTAPRMAPTMASKIERSWRPMPSTPTWRHTRCPPVRPPSSMNTAGRICAPRFAR